MALNCKGERIADKNDIAYFGAQRQLSALKAKQTHMARGVDIQLLSLIKF